MPSAAPRIDSRLVAALGRLDDDRIPIAEVNRRVGEVALRFGLTKPSYEQVRTLVHRRRARSGGPTTGEVLLDIMLRTRPPDALVEHLSGVGVAHRRT